MVKKCCVTDCKMMPNPYKLHYFSFPKVKRELWKQILLMLNNQEYRPTSSSKICVKHFDEKYVHFNFGQVILSSDANPTCFPNSPLNSIEVLDYLISQNTEDPLKITDDHPKISLKRKADDNLSIEAVSINDLVTPTISLVKKSKIVENSSKEKQFSNSEDIFKNMQDITNWTLREMIDAFNVLKSTLHQRTNKIQALTRKNNRLESLLARFCVDDLVEKPGDPEICRICLKKHPKETKPFYLSVQITDEWLPTFLSKFKSCSGDILLTKIENKSTPICDVCLQYALANYTAVFSGEKEEIKRPILKSPTHIPGEVAKNTNRKTAAVSGEKEEMKTPILKSPTNKIIPEEVAKKITEETNGKKVIILKKISRNKIPNKIKQITKKKLEATVANPNPSNVSIVRTTLKDATKPNERKEPEVSEAPTILEVTAANENTRNVKPKLNKSNKRKEPEEINKSQITEDPHNPIICEYCGESFTDKKIHLQHQSTHFGDMKFVCNNCDRCFLTDSDLKLHKIIHCNA